jgi:hypothetical protein
MARQPASTKFMMAGRIIDFPEFMANCYSRRDAPGVRQELVLSLNGTAHLDGQFPAH